MALRISSAEMVSSAMARVLFLLFRRIWSLGAVSRSAGQPAAGRFEPVDDAAVDDLVADADDQATEHLGVDGHLYLDRPPVEAAEDLGQSFLLGIGHGHRRRHEG